LFFYLIRVYNVRDDKIYSNIMDSKFGFD